jgi:hypothetical protein
MAEWLNGQHVSLALKTCDSEVIVVWLRFTVLITEQRPKNLNSSSIFVTPSHPVRLAGSIDRWFPAMPVSVGLFHDFYRFCAKTAQCRATS